MRKLAIVLLMVLIVPALVVGFSTRSTTYAKTEYVSSFTTAYPNTKGTALAACATCHTKELSLNPYGAALATVKLDYAAVASKDSDGDGATNAAEIAALTFPGDPSSKPTGTGSGSGGSSSGGSSTPASYRDIAGSPARSAVESLVKAGVLAGGGGYFRPGAAITRVEFACLLQRLFKLPGTSPYLAAFSDVPKNHWAYSTVEAIVRSALMAPSAEGEFNPAGTVARASAARSASTALGHGTDVASLSDADALAYAANLGLFTSGSGPATSLTRGDAAILIAKVIPAKDKLVDPLVGVANYAIGPEQCAKCHSEEAAKYQTTMHSRMVRTLGPGATTANFADPAAPIKASDVQFVIGTNTTNYFVGKDFRYLPATWDAEANKWGTRSASAWLGSCTTCHTTGYDATLKTFVATNITCESCHGGGAEHVATGDPSRIKDSLDVDMCESCHGGERQVGQLKETTHYTVFADLSQTPSYKGSCTECHSATVRIAEEKGETPPTLEEFKTGGHQNDRVGVTCVVCHDPHEKTEEAQLRVSVQETCIQCHTGELSGETWTAGKAVHHPQKEMWLGVGAIGVDPMPAAKTATCADCHMTNGNHLFEVGTPVVNLPVKGKDTPFDTCGSCHTGMTAEKVQGLFDAFDTRLASLKDQLAVVDAHIANEESFGRDMATAKALRDKAFTNISFAENDKSKGIHNPAYVEAMFDAAEEFLQQAMTGT